MILNEYTTVLGLRLSTISLFLLFSIVLSSYVIWREAKKEGFDEESVFDMIVILLLGSLLIGRMVWALENMARLTKVIVHVVSFWKPGVDFIGAASGGLSLLYIMTKGRKWSLYRILDIFSMGVSLAFPLALSAMVFVRGRYDILVAVGLLLILHAILMTLRGQGFVFGGVFGVSLILGSSIMYVFFGNPKSLIFFVLLFTLGCGVLIKRLRIKKMSVAGISKDFLKSIQDLLKKKDRELAQEELVLEKGDSYNVADRDTMNNEDVDEAKEDEQHENTDILKKSIEEMRLQIRKALSMIKIGTYGICEVCHKPIDSARLKAFPQATTCVECEDKKG